MAIGHLLNQAFKEARPVLGESRGAKHGENPKVVFGVFEASGFAFVAKRSPAYGANLDFVVHDWWLIAAAKQGGLCG